MDWIEKYVRSFIVDPFKDEEIDNIFDEVIKNINETFKRYDIIKEITIDKSSKLIKFPNYYIRYIIKSEGLFLSVHMMPGTKGEGYVNIEFSEKDKLYVLGVEDKKYQVDEGYKISYENICEKMIVDAFEILDMFYKNR